MSASRLDLFCVTLSAAVLSGISAAGALPPPTRSAAQVAPKPTHCVAWVPPKPTHCAAWVAASTAAEPPLPSGLEDQKKEKKKPPADEPALPGGLEDHAEPKLPGGLEKDEEPKLPTGLTKPTGPKPQPKPKKDLKWLDLTGFWEVRGGVRTQHDPYQRSASLGETRLQLEWEKTFANLTFKLVGDLLCDPVLGHHTVDLEDGQGLFDLRQANVLFTPVSFMDVKLGRQILTWGTGDLVFINDLFPKDWPSFLIGRDVEYLKAPSDALKISLFSDVVNVDLVYTPRFDPDRFIRGRRISYFSPMLGRRAGRDAVIRADIPNEWFDDSEWAVRIRRKLGPTELAAYGYWGYWKSPAGMNPLTGRSIFPRLSVYGASVRSQVGKGIGNVEAGYYDSRQDADGDNPFVNNSELRLLVGYERDLPEIASDLTVAAQYYVEWMIAHEAYRRALPAGVPRAHEIRQVVTLRVTKKLMNQNLTLSLFAFYSPSGDDMYLRPNVQYKIDDHWTVEIGGNVFVGSHRHTFFGQFERDTNLYCSLRYGF